MFNELPKGFKEVETDRKKELVHTCTINDDGQVIFGTKFLKKGSLLSKKEATFVKLLWNESEQQLIFAFASEEEIHGDDPDFDESSLGEEIFKLEKMKTAKGLKVALRDRCSEKLIPPENYDYYFVEDVDLTCDHEKKFITLETANKHPRPNTKEQKRLNKLKEGKKKKESRKATFMDMVRAYKEDPAGHMEHIIDSNYSEEDILEFLTLHEKMLLTQR